MADQHHDPADTGPESHPVKIAVAVFVGAILMVVGIMLLAQFAISTRPLGSGNEQANSPEAIAKRIAHPVSLAVDAGKGQAAGSTPAASPVAVAAVIPPAAVAGGAAGADGIYKASCAVCHAAGVAGAPKSGDKAAWAARIAQGKATLYKNAIAGFQGKFGVMPAKGGNAGLSDADVKAVVDLMIAQNK